MNLGISGAPDGSGYIKIYSTETAFAALKADGSITVWGDSNRGGLDAPFGRGYTKNYQRVHLCLQDLNHPTLRLNHQL
jgi:hypothetical protein